MRWHPLLIACWFVLLAWALLHQVEPQTLRVRLDPWMLAVAGLAYLYCIFVIVRYTPWSEWTWLGVGLVLTFIASAMLLATLAAPVTPAWAPWRGEFATVVRARVWLEVIRALYIVGGPVLVVGLVIAIRQDRSTVLPGADRKIGEER